MASATCFIFIIVVYFGSANVLAAPCTTDQVMGCLDGMDSFNPSDLDSTCKLSQDIADCLKNLKNTCTVGTESEAILVNAQKQLEQIKPMCEGTLKSVSGSANGLPPCEMDQTMACLNGMDSFNPSDLKSTCKLSQAMSDCMKNLKNTCNVGTELEAILANAEKQLEQIKPMCEGISKSVSGGSAGPCKVEEIMGCLDGMDSFNPSDLDSTCKLAQDMSDCLKNLMNTCNVGTESETFFANAEKQLEQMKPMCKGFGGNTSSTCSASAMQGCFKGMTEETDMTKICNAKDGVVTCLKGVLGGCDNEMMKDIIQKSLDGIEKDPSCGDADSQGCSMMDRAKCIMPLGQMMAANKITSKMCKAHVDATKCLEALKSNCGSEAQKEEINKTLKDMTRDWSEECCNAGVKIRQECDNVESLIASKASCLKFETAFNCIEDRSAVCKKGPLKKGNDKALQEISGHLNQCKNDKGYEVKVDFEKHMKSTAEDEKTGNGHSSGGNTGHDGGDSGSVLKQSIGLLASAFLLVIFTITF